MAGQTVAVTGADEGAVADAASGLADVADEMQVRTVGGERSELPADVDCVVRVVANGSDLEPATASERSTPVVLFADVAPADVERALAAGATDVVQRGGDEAYAVLAHRVERAAERTAASASDPAGEERYRELITQLQAVSRDLMQAPSRDSVARVVTRAIERVLGHEMSVVRLYDAERQVLEPAAASDAVGERMSERPVYGLDEGQPGTVFASGEPAVYDDVRTVDDDHDREPARSAMYFPVGVHGTLSVGSPEVGAFDDVDRQVTALLATNAAAACNRARREREVREARERIATILDRIEGLVQDTVEVLVEARSREEVEGGVCTQLADADPYVFAWVARPDVREETLSAHEWAGDAGLDVDDAAVTMDGDDPGAVAYRTGDSQVVDGDALADADAGWLGAAEAAGIQSVMAIPLGYTDSSYGTLYVGADRADAFDRREQVVLESLGRAVANTINAIESGRILSANRVIEMAFTVDDRDLLFSRLSAATGATVASAGTVTQEDGSLRVYLTATDADGEAVLATLEGDDDVASATLVAEHDGEALFDVTMTASLVETLVDHGAVPKNIESENGVVRYDVELPYEAEARELFGIVEDRYDSTDLVGYREHERPVRTQQEFRAALSDRFTDRQETALRTAYLGGFFEWPREVDGDELSDGMDISRPTYHQHLRAAQQKVFEELFDPQ